MSIPYLRIALKEAITTACNVQLVYRSTPQYVHHRIQVQIYSAVLYRLTQRVSLMVQSYLPPCQCNYARKVYEMDKVGNFRRERGVKNPFPSVSLPPCNGSPQTCQQFHWCKSKRRGTGRQGEKGGKDKEDRIQCVLSLLNPFLPSTHLLCSSLLPHNFISSPPCSPPVRLMGHQYGDDI